MLVWLTRYGLIITDYSPATMPQARHENNTTTAQCTHVQLLL